MKSLRNLLLVMLMLPLSLMAQDTLVAEIRVINTSNGIEVSYSKDMRYSDEDIARYISSVLKSDSLQPPKREPKIIKM